MGFSLGNIVNPVVNLGTGGSGVTLSATAGGPIMFNTSLVFKCQITGANDGRNGIKPFINYQHS